MEDCSFCNIMDTDRRKSITDTILHESANFFIITTLGCFVKNYIMIVSKKHIVSMCYLDDDEWKELIKITNAFRNILKKEYGFYPLAFEHGASISDLNRSANSVSHAHLHLVPHMLSNKDEMINALDFKALNGYDDFLKNAFDSSYLFFTDNDGFMYLNNDTESVMPSQILRKWLAKDIGIADRWDWHIHPFEENIISTISDMSAIIKDNYQLLEA